MVQRLSGRRRSINGGGKCEGKLQVRGGGMVGGTTIRWRRRPVAAAAAAA